jgi:hypothetical protein
MVFQRDNKQVGDVALGQLFSSSVRELNHSITTGCRTTAGNLTPRDVSPKLLHWTIAGLEEGMVYSRNVLLESGAWYV